MFGVSPLYAPRAESGIPSIPDPVLMKLGHQVPVHIDGLQNLPCHVGYCLKARTLGHYTPYQVRGYTIELTTAMGWYDAGGVVLLCKLWQLPNGSLLACDPATYLPLFAWRPHVLGSARP